MNDYQRSLITEHSELLVRITRLHNYIYCENHDDDKIEFANKAIQLAFMKKYAECLITRLSNVDVVFADGEYYLHVGGKPISLPQVPTTEDKADSDYDKDSKKDNEK